MRKAENWKDYELSDCSDGERLERWGDVILIRPDPQVIWKTPKQHPLWRKADARYIRSSSGGGRWEVYKKIPDVWSIAYGEMQLRVKTMGFKHTGVFPEQAVNWDQRSRSACENAESFRLHGSGNRFRHGCRCRRRARRCLQRHGAVGKGKRSCVRCCR